MDPHAQRAGRPDQPFFGTHSKLAAQAALDAFIGCADSGDPAWASRDIHELRSEAAARKLAEGA